MRSLAQNIWNCLAAAAAAAVIVVDVVEIRTTEDYHRQPIIIDQCIVVVF